MSNLILHHYPNSPFAEKIRAILGYKKLAWKSVMIPAVMPKPDLTALTGGYRRTPVLQIGSDIYCDTAIIVDVLERIAPEPSLFPAGQQGLVTNLAQWADTTLFWTAVTWAFQPAGAKAILGQMPAEQAQVFRDDRAAMRGGAVGIGLAEASAALPQYLQRLENILQDGRSFLFGTAPSLADFSCYHPLWFVHKLALVPEVGVVLEGVPLVRAWLQRMLAIGHHQFDKMRSEEALSIAASSSSAVLDAGQSQLHGIALGDQVQIMPSDYGLDPVQGELVLLQANEMALRRHDARAGMVVVHFPRIGFQIKKI